MTANDPSLGIAALKVMLHKVAAGFLPGKPMPK